MKTNSYTMFHYWIQYCEFRTLNSLWFSIMNSYHNVIFLNSDSWTQIWYCEFRYMNSYTHQFIYLFRIYTYEFIYMNLYTHEFIFSFHVWKYEFILTLNSYDSQYEFIWSFHTWIQFIWIHTYILIYEFV